MIRLYLRLFGTTLLAVLVSGAAMLILEETVIAQFYTGKLRDRFHPIFNLTERLLDTVPETEWAAKLSEEAAAITHPVGDKYALALASLQQAAGRWNLSASEQGLLRDGGILYFETQDRQAVAVRRLGDSDQALELWLPGIAPQKHVGKILFVSSQVIFLALLIGLWVRPFWRDLKQANAVADRIGQGDFKARLTLHRSSPLFSLADEVNGMAARINDLLTTHRELATSVSHELRNPLMRLRFRHSLAREALSDDDRERQWREMECAIDELDQLVDEILTYAKAKNAGGDMELEPVVVTDWIDPILNAGRQIADAEGRELSIDFHSTVETAALEPQYMSRALSNLISNASRFAVRRIQVSLDRVHGRNTLRVDDDGPGIPEAQREQVFEPFWRGDQSRSRKTGGFGIGLALVRRIAQWHGGDVHVVRSKLGGACFVIDWPEKEMQHD